MFTGIIESCGIVKDLRWQQSNLEITIESEISSGLNVDQSISHDGVCLTITSVENNTHRITAVKETLDRSTLGTWAIGQLVNLERAMVFGGRLDGHLVQGHVDDFGTCEMIQDMDGSRFMTFSFAKSASSPAYTALPAKINFSGVGFSLFSPRDVSLLMDSKT